MEVRILGPLQVVEGGTPVDLRRPQRWALIAALAVRANQVVPTERLIEDLWNGRPSEGAAASLRAHISHVRRLLAEAGAGAPLVSRRPGYVLELGPDDLDAWRFERLVAEGRSELAAGAADAAVLTLRAAADLWRGPALADVSDTHFAGAEARRLEEARLSALEDLVDARLGTGDHQALAGELRALVAEHPLRERLWSQLILALYRAGRQAEALRAYSELRETLVEELGIGPGPALQRLEDDVLRQDPGLDWAGPGSEPIGRGEPVPGRRLVPAAISSFVGRVREQAAVRERLAGARLVTLTGPGGCGKTRLAQAVAGGTDDPVAFIELGPVADARLLEEAVAGALGVPEDPARPLTDSLQAAIGSRPLLLVLDNCEHVVPASAHLADALLRGCPGLRLLATSRRRLGITGEVVWPVPALRLPDGGDRNRGQWWASEAVDLFANRAAAVSPGFAVAAGNAEAVVAVCQALDGLPLAIELAAARMSVLSVDELLARLSDPFSVLSVGSSVAPPRQQTLRAAVDWSYRSLVPEEQILFSRLSLFRGGFSIEAAEAVASEPGLSKAAVLDGVGALVEKSLVARLPNRPGRARFRLLETLRTYARERLGEHGEAVRAGRQHASWCRDVAQSAARQLRGPDEAKGLALLDLEEENLRAGLDWALAAPDADLAVELSAALWWYWFRRGRVREGRDRFAGVLALDVVQGEPRSIGLAVAAYLAWAAADADQAAALSRESLLLAERDDAMAPVLALDVAGLVAAAEGDLAQARVLHQQALDAFRAGGDPWGEAWVLRHLSGTAYRSGDLTAAATLAEESRGRFLALGDDWGIAGSTDALASIARRRGELAEARGLGEESIERHRAMGGGVGLAIALHHQAEVLLDLGDLAGAAELAIESMALDRRHGDEEDLAASSALLAEIERRRAPVPSP